MSTQEQRDYRAVLQAEINATGRRYRLTSDADGFR